MFQQVRGFLLAALLLAPLAGAREGDGVFTLEGAPAFPGGTNATGAPLALFVPQTANLSWLEVHVARGMLIQYRIPLQRIDGPVIDPILVQIEGTERSTWTLSDATVSLIAGNHFGTLGIYTAADAVLHVGSPVEMAWEPRTASDIGENRTIAAEEAKSPASTFYLERLTGPHLLGVGNGSLAYEGGGILKLIGPDVEIHSKNITRHETGFKRGGPGQSTYLTILSIRFDAPATVTVRDAPFQTALESMDATWDGPLRFTPREGTLRTEAGLYFTQGGPAQLDGRFEAHLVPTAEGESRIDLSGEIRSSTLAFAPAVTFVPAKTVISAWLLLILATAVVVGAAGGVAAGATMLRHVRALLARAGPRPPFTVEDCVDTANAALDMGDDAEALEWLRRAKVLAPTSARIAADLAFCLANLGAIDEALAAYQEAHRLSADGEAAYNAALAAHEAGQPAEVVLRWLGEAVERTPQYVENAREDFPHLVEGPAWRALERRATERGGAGA